jgi:hypothetical protein
MRPIRRQTEPLSARPVRLESLLLAAVVALLVAVPLIPSESAVAYGTTAPLCLLWMLLLVGWSLLNLLRPDPSVRFGWTGVTAVALIGWHTLSALTAGMQGNARQALDRLRRSRLLATPTAANASPVPSTCRRVDCPGGGRGNPRRLRVFRQQAGPDR